MGELDISTEHESSLRGWVLIIISPTGVEGRTSLDGAVAVKGFPVAMPVNGGPR
ncbi:hypothetical protein PT974_11201 [Cladobotryum mycophilum]|uniref:Uncharacterized protein n=1 Tax=Cladobotryum mycophilum TaxID=491253 RepID=A0ABR0S4I8_9HYPO